MCKRFYIFTQWMAGILMMLAIVACQETIDDEEYGKPADHTLLMYLIGDNDLSEELGRNVTDASNAIRDSIADGKLNLLVYKDNKKSGDHLPRLYRIHSTESLELEEEVLESWDDEVDSCDPVFMAEVIKTAFSRFNTTLKGMAIGSHAAGWVPQLANRTYNSPRRDAFGTDQNTPNQQSGSTEIWQLREALEQSTKLDYIIMDCCNMGNAEVAYELRNVAHYMTAGATEIQGKGMPYDKVVTRLSQCKSAKDLPKALDYCAQCYYKAYVNHGGATISVYDLTSMDKLADSYRQLIDSNRDRLAEMNEAKGPAIDKWVEKFQHYGREYREVHTLYYFYDIDDVITWMSSQNPQAATDAHRTLQEVVLSEYHSSNFYEIKIDHSCGMAVTLPEVLHLADDHDLGYGKYFGNLRADNLKAAYHLTAWGNKMGY